MKPESATAAADTRTQKQKAVCVTYSGRLGNDLGRRRVCGVPASGGTFIKSELALDSTIFFNTFDPTAQQRSFHTRHSRTVIKMYFTTTLAVVLASAALTTAQTTVATASTPPTACASVSIIPNMIPQPSGQANISACPSSIPLGGECGADAQCMNDAECWGTTAFTIRRCGNFNAACNVSSQCAFNSCNGGLCNGFLPSSLSSSGTADATGSVTTGGGGYAGPTGGYAGGSGNGTAANGTGGAYPSVTPIQQGASPNGAQGVWMSGGLLLAVVGVGALVL